MSKIKVMSTALSNRIAAGEVIERPASVVKELVENSIDAGSSFVSVEIERAGSKLIAVTDNGCGMDAEDARLALEQHGTSKLLSEDDLEHIMTLGFRGEAIPSIASVSNFTMFTRPADSPEGTRIDCHGGDEVKVSPCGGNVGTRIEVRDIFFNLPARKKFLKSPATEEHHIEEMMILLAIGHPEIGFRLQLDNRVAFHTPAAKQQQQRLRELFGKSFVEKMLFFEHTENGLHISGCTAVPGFTRPSRRDQRIFINSRPVEAQAVYRGIKEGYATLAEPGRYNPAVLFIDMPPEELDVNVHPAKREVRFKSEYIISRAVASAISAALRRQREPENEIEQPENLPLSGKLPLSLVLDAAEVRYQLTEKVQDPLEGLILDAPEQPVSLPELKTVPLRENEEDEKIIPVKVETVPQVAETAQQPFEAVIEPEKTTEKIEVPIPSAVPSMRGIAEKSWAAPAAFSGNWPTAIIGVFDQTYILAESPGGLVLIDQHAAHERVMFERLMDAAQNNVVVQQNLLLPEVLELPRQEVTLLMSQKELFERFGFDMEKAGNTTIMLNSIPQNFGKCKDIAGFFTDMLHELSESSSLSTIRPELLARAACRAAVKAHDQLDKKAMEKLLDDLKNCRQGTLCPHGRPTMITLSLKEIEKRFQRR